MTTSSIAETHTADATTQTVRTRDAFVAGLTDQPLPAAPPALVIRAAMNLRRFFLRCADAVCPPEVVMIDRISSLTYTHQLGAIARLRIADLLADGPLTARELARRTQYAEDALHRVLRSLASTGVFRLDSQGRFHNNRLSRALCSDRPSLIRAMVEYFSSAANAAAWADSLRTIETGKNAFARVHGRTVWQWFEEHPDEERTFAQAMMGITIGDAPFIAALYPFREVQQLCDVGGGSGILLSELLLRNPKMRGVLFDAANVLASAADLLARRGVSDRVECVAGSFLDTVPEHCDAYLLKSVLHDWDDARCKHILANVRRAIPTHGRLLLVELVLEPNDTRNAMTTNVDVHMMVVCEEGRERSRSEFEALLAATGFRLARVFPGPVLSLLEALPV